MTRHRFTPKMCRHLASGQAVVRLAGKDFYLGKWRSPEAEAAYHRKIAEWIAAGPAAVAAPEERMRTVAELAAAYMIHAVTWYGPRSSDVFLIRSSMRPLLTLYADLPIDDFGPMKLKAVRQTLCTDRRDLARGTINRQVHQIRRMFRWAASEELIDASLYQRLTVVEGLRAGRGGREVARRRPVAWREVHRVKPYLRPIVWRMVLIQWLTGMRSQEICRMRPADIDRQGDVWVYRPAHHKTEGRGHLRLVPIGPRAQRVLAELLIGADSESPIFSPAVAVASMIQERKKVSRPGAWRAARRPPGEAYSAASYRRAVKRACKRAGIEPWTPHQLRHSAATRVRSRYDLDTARAVLGHAAASMTLEYADLDLAKATRAAGEMG
jgi:integrase